MALDIGELVGYVKLDHSGVGRGITAAQRDLRSGMEKIQRDAAVHGQKIGDAAGQSITSSLKTGLRNLGGVVAGAFAVDRAVAGLAALKDAASDLNETTSMAGVIFGKNAKAMDAWAQNAPRALGLAREEALRASATFGDMFLQLGFAEDKAADMSKAVLQMAADLGSFKNLETADVTERIAAAFRGEYDSLQMLVPNINAARVETEALAATGKANAASLSAQEKAAATLAIVQKDSARAQGDFARTADGAANATKTASAMTKDLMAQVGQGLLPAYIAMVAFGRDEVIPFLSETADRLGDAKDAAEPVTGAIGDLVDAWQKLPSPIQTATVSLVAFLALRGRLEAMGVGLQDRVGKGASAASSAVDTMRLHMMYAGDQATSSSNRFTGAAKAIGYTAGQGLRGAASGLVGLLGGPWGVAFTAATGFLAAWAQQHHEAEQRVQSLTAAIDADSGALGKNTKAAVANGLEKSGAAEAAAKLGINLATLTNAALGVPGAIESVNTELERLASLQSDPGLNLDKYGDLVGQRRNMEKVREVLNGTNGELQEAVGQYQRHAAMVGQDADATAGAADAQAVLGGAAKDTTKELEEQQDAARKAAQEVLKLADAQLEASGAQISYQDALAGVEERLTKRKELEAELRKATDPKDRARIKDELKDYALTLDLSTEAGRDNQKALNDLAKASRDKAQADVEAGASLKDVRDRMDEARDRFIENARRMGLSEKAAEKMATQFGLTKKDVDNIAKAVEDLPAAKQIKIEADTAAAKTRLQTLREQLADIRDKSVVVTVQGRYISGDTLPNGGKSTAGGQVMGGGAAPRGMRYDGQGRLVLANEDGGHYTYGAAKMFSPADGIKHVFNEPATGGESFIPHAVSKRPGALRVLAETADLFGLSVHPKSETRINKTSLLHTGPVYANDPSEYLAALEVQARLNALTEH